MPMATVRIDQVWQARQAMNDRRRTQSSSSGNAPASLRTTGFAGVFFHAGPGEVLYARFSSGATAPVYAAERVRGRLCFFVVPREPSKPCWGCRSRRERDAGLVAGIAFLMLVVVLAVAAIWGAGE